MLSHHAEKTLVWMLNNDLNVDQSIKYVIMHVIFQSISFIIQISTVTE